MDDSSVPSMARPFVRGLSTFSARMVSVHTESDCPPLPGRNIRDAIYLYRLASRPGQGPCQQRDNDPFLAHLFRHLR